LPHNGISWRQKLGGVGFKVLWFLKLDLLTDQQYDAEIWVDTSNSSTSTGCLPNDNLIL
jgi:hypothetical protein